MGREPGGPTRQTALKARRVFFTPVRRRGNAGESVREEAALVETADGQLDDWPVLMQQNSRALVVSSKDQRSITRCRSRPILGAPALTGGTEARVDALQGEVLAQSVLDLRLELVRGHHEPLDERDQPRREPCCSRGSTVNARLASMPLLLGSDQDPP